MEAKDIAAWMLCRLTSDGCLYQDDVVDHLVKAGAEGLLRENAEGNLVLSMSVLNAFKKLTPEKVVWVKPDLYWRFRVPEDEVGREARG